MYTNGWQGSYSATTYWASKCQATEESLECVLLLLVTLASFEEVLMAAVLSALFLALRKSFTSDHEVLLRICLPNTQTQPQVQKALHLGNIVPKHGFYNL